MGFIKRPGAALGILTGINVLNYIDRYVGASVLPKIISDLHISDGQAGALASVFIFVYALACPFMGWLGDRGRRLPMATVGVLVFCLATVGSGLAQSFAVLLIARALVGIGEASYAIVTPSLISDLYPPQKRSQALAIFYSAIPVGSALSYILGGQIGEAFGWRAAFFGTGGPGVILALSLLLLVEPVRGQLDGPQAAVEKLSIGQALRALRSRPSFIVNTAAQTIYTFTMGGLAAWMPTYFYRERQIPLSRGTFLFGICLVLAGFLGTIVGGQLGDRLSRRWPTAPFVLSGAALVASLPFVIASVLAPQPAIFWPAMFVTLFLLFLNTGPLNAAMSNVLPAHLRGRGFAIYSFAIHVLGDGPSPFIIGTISDAVGLRTPVLGAGCMLTFAGLVLLAGRATLPRDLARASA
jgi:predicted MFS family arabinose efflux permease